jgi:hypothetical protein
MPAVFFVVRATVADPAKRAAFDVWYSKEHLPDAAKSFGVTKAWRFWSLADPSLHQATYQFTDEAALDRALNGADMNGWSPISIATGRMSRARARRLCWRRNLGLGERSVIPEQPAGLNPESRDVDVQRFRVHASRAPE